MGIRSNSGGFGNYDPSVHNFSANMTQMFDGLSSWTSMCVVWIVFEIV